MALTHYSANDTLDTLIGEGTSHSYSHTVPAGATILVVQVTNQLGGVPNSVTFGGTALTELTGASILGKNTYAGIWYLENPTVQTANIVESYGGTFTHAHSKAQSFSGYNTTTPWGTLAQAGGTGNNPDPMGSDIVTATDNSYIFSVAGIFGEGIGLTADAGLTANVSSGTSILGVSYRSTTTAGTYQTQWTVGSTGWDYASVQAELQPASGGGGGGKISRYHNLNGLGGLGQQTFNPMG